MFSSEEKMIDYENRIDILIEKLERLIIIYSKSGDRCTAAVISNILTSTKSIFGRQ